MKLKINTIKYTQTSLFIFILLMGVPALYKWLCDKYPKIVEIVKQNTNINENSYGLNDLNRFDVDNLYLDTNGYYFIYNVHA